MITVLVCIGIVVGVFLGVCLGLMAKAFPAKQHRPILMAPWLEARDRIEGEWTSMLKDVFAGLGGAGR